MNDYDKQYKDLLSDIDNGNDNNNYSENLNEDSFDRKEYPVKKTFFSKVRYVQKQD
jgi:hypothetical protein